MNSLRNKFGSLIGQITGNIDILMVSETKLDESFPIGQFFIEGFSILYRVDRNANGGGIMLFVRGHSLKTSFYRNFSNRGFFRWDKPKKKEITQLLLQFK